MKRLIILCLLILLLLTSCSNENYDKHDFFNKIGNTSQNVNQGGIMAHNNDYLYISTQQGVVEYDIKTGQNVIIEGVYPKFGYINVVDEYIFYVKDNVDSTENEKLTVASLDGRFEKFIGNEQHFPFVVIDEWLYSTTRRGGELSRINIKNAEKKVLANAPVEEYIIVGDTIFYNDGKSLFKVNLDGTNMEIVIDSIKIKSFSAIDANEKYYFINSSEKNSIYSYDPVDCKMKKIIEGSFSFLQMLDEENCLSLNIEGKLEIHNVYKQTSETIYDGVVNFQVFDTDIFFKDYKETYHQYFLEDKRIVELNFDLSN